jgi:hypothetical protein
VTLFFSPDLDAIADNVKSDLTWPVVSEILLSIGLTLVGLFSYNFFLSVWGLISNLSWAFGGKDDIIGTAQVSFDHTTLEKPFDDDEEGEGEGILIEGDGNKWRLTGSLTVNPP